VRSKLVALVLCSGMAFVSGCGRSEPQYSYREGLSPRVQEYVRTSVDQKFGTPHKIRVWDKLPLQAHAAVATVGEGSKDTSLVVEIGEKSREIKPGQEVVWVGGTMMPRDAAPVTLDAFDQKSKTLTLASGPKLPAKAGDKIVIGPGETLTHGRLLYAEHCQHCHGVAGDGQGPTAPYLNVRPRDYRKGQFKFTSTKEGLKAHRSDLARIIEDGIPGTYMPSFKLLKPEESHSIVEYVLFLAMRGESEYQMNNILATDYSEASVLNRVKDGETEEKVLEEFVTRVKDGEIDEEVNQRNEKLVADWIAAQAPEAVIVPKEKRNASDEESIKRGRELYLSNNLNCVACHGESGLGDGVQTYSVTKNTETGQDNTEPGLYDTWGNKIKPRNLRLGMFRGGRRPIDIYARIEAGIKGTPMPAFGAKLTEQQKWDIVNYVLELPHEHRIPGTGITPSSPAHKPAPVAAAAH
jgi:mono/diheme cytochrome c family protein